MPPKRIVLFCIILIVMIIIFLFGIFGINSLWSSSNQLSATNNTLPLSTLDSTSQNTAVNTPEPKPSFTGAIIVGITRPVNILGKEGFSPSDINLKSGDSITWKNTDPQQKLIVLTFQRWREQNNFFTSPILLPEEEWEYVFWEEGEYNYWTTAYGVEGKVIVWPCKNRFCPKKE